MGFVHGKGEVFKIGSTDLSAYITEVDVKRAGDSHDITAFGAVGHAYLGGLTDGTISLKGTYDDGDATNPRITFQGALATTVTWTHRTTGTGSGKPEVSGSAVVTAYEEVASATDVINWSVELQISGTVVTTDQT